MTDDESEFANPYTAASMLPPGRKRLRAEMEFLEGEVGRLHERLQDMEDDSGQIKDGMRQDWSMVKGKLDQTRLLHGVILKAIITDCELRQGEDPVREAKEMATRTIDSWESLNSEEVHGTLCEIANLLEQLD